MSLTSKIPIKLILINTGTTLLASELFKEEIAKNIVNLALCISRMYNFSKIAKFVPRSVTEQTNNENTTNNKREIFPW
jgi:hypothetical protein